MPVYSQAKSENQGELFNTCSTETVAERNSSANTFNNDHYSLVKSYSFYLAAQGSNHTENFTFALDMTVPAYPPAVAAAMNIANNKDKIETLVIKEIKRAGTTAKGKLVSEITATNGALTYVSVIRPNLDGSEKPIKDTYGSLKLTFKFEKMTFDDKVSNSLGLIKTSEV